MQCFKTKQQFEPRRWYHARGS